MAQAFDFVFIGAGQNQLSAAAYLAKAGYSVVLLETQSHWGGGCASGEVTQPGFIHDLHATNVFMAQANPLIRLDELELQSRFGLRFASLGDNPYHGTIFEDQSALALYTDLERSCESIARYSANDAAVYRDFAEAARRYVRLFTFSMFTPPPRAETLLAVLGGSAEGRSLLELLNTSAWDAITSRFEDIHTRIHLLRLTTEMMLEPRRHGTGFALLLMVGLYHTYPRGFVIGGTQKFSDALAQCIQHHGGEIKLGVSAREIDVHHGRACAVVLDTGEKFEARKAVVSGLAPWKLGELNPCFEALSRRVGAVAGSDYTVFLIHLALNEAPKPKAPSEFQAMGFTTLAPLDLDAISRLTTDVTAGTVPKDFSACYVCATNHDSSRAPPGKATLYLYHTVPGALAQGGVEAWDAIKQAQAEWILKNTRRFVPNLSVENVAGMALSSPLDYQRYSPSYRNGDVASLAMMPDPFILGRPLPELAQFRVPDVEGMYLCGPFMHPGGGANGGGRAVAIRILQDLKADLSATFSL